MLRPTIVPPHSVAAYTACCSRIVSGEQSAYEGGEELMEVVSGAQRYSELPGEVFNLWAELTDRWEFGNQEIQERTEGLIRQAAASFLELHDPATQLPSWSEAWFERIFA